jgi:cAMP phosphodiesterase
MRCSEPATMHSKSMIVAHAAQAATAQAGKLTLTSPQQHHEPLELAVSASTSVHPALCIAYTKCYINSSVAMSLHSYLAGSSL